MDTDWTFSSCSWLWEDDSEFKKECIDSDWTNEEDKTFESSNVPLPHYHQSNDNSNHVMKKKTLRGVNRGIPWTEEEHRRFLDGLEKYGKGDWKSIAKFSVQTKSNSQVASHAQKYFKRLNSTSKDGKRHSINDVTVYDHLATMPAVGESTTGNVTGNNDSALMNALSEIERLMQGDFGEVPTPSSFAIPAIPEIHSLVRDNDVPDFSLFDFPCTSDIQQPSVQEIGAPGSSSCIPLTAPGSSSCIPLTAPGSSSCIPLTAPGSSSDIGALGSGSGIPLAAQGSSSDIPSASAAETMDPEVFILPHFLD